MNRLPALFGALVMSAVACSSVAAADDGAGPLGVTFTAPADARTALVGALFPADGAQGLAGGHFCTASVVHSPGRDLIVTAAHCLDDAGDLVFVPGYRDGKAPYGVWAVRTRYLPGGWTEGQDEDSDIAFASVGSVAGRDVEDVVGGNPLAAGTAAGAVTLTGYPDARETPVTCTGRPTAYSPTQQRIECPDFPSGTSGSPWVDGDGKVVGVLGGHERGGATDDVSYSVVLGDEAARLYATAVAGG
ncbi:S1 family peptidase [Streptomyces mangrovisoli]|nr:serine protease [Streptomyces mangrovisoli]